MIPSFFVFMDSLPITPNGKIDRKSLPEPDASAMRKEYVEPRNRTELELVRIWEETLGISPIGMKDNFFEIGGHSLLAVRIMGEIKKAFGKSIPIAALFNAPVIEGLSEILASEDELSVSPLVPFQPKGIKSPLFFLPGGRGRSFYLYQLAGHLGEDRPFYGLEEPGVYENRREPADRMEKLADIFVKAIYEIQPDGPYFIAGHSGGVPVAFAMIRQLEKEGRRVSFFGVVDMAAGFGEGEIEYENDDSEILLDNARVAAERLGREIDIDYDRARSLSYDDQLILVAKELTRIQWLSPGDGVEKLRNLVKLSNFRANMFRSYAPGSMPLDAPITLFRAKEPHFTMESYEEFLKEPDMGWKRFSEKPVEIVEVPGNHVTMISEPHVRVLAEKLNESMEKAFGFDDSLIFSKGKTGKRRDFQETDAEGRFWALDMIHFPGMVTPVDFSFLLKTMYDDTAGAVSERYGFSRADVLSRHIGGYFYFSHDYETVSKEKTDAAFEKMKKDAMRVDELWETEWLHEIKDHIEFWENYNIKSASAKNFAAHVKDARKRLKRIWEIHHFLYYNAMLVLTLFEELCQDLFPDDPKENAHGMLSGFLNSFLESDIALWKISRMASDLPGIPELFERNDANDVWNKIKKSKKYRDFFLEFNKYLENYGGVCHLISSPAFDESPEDIVKRLKDYMARPDEDSPGALLKRLKKERENEVLRAFEKLSGHPGPVRKEFEKYLKAAQYANMLITEHTWWIEGRVPYCARRIIQEAGRRLVKSKAIDSADDIFYFMFDEIAESLERLPDIIDRKKSVEERKREEDRFGESNPPEFIGEPSGEAPPENIFTKISANLMPMPTVSGFEFRHGELKGAPGSPGSATGVARNIRSVSEGFKKLAPGDIMIAGATLPDWAPLFGSISALVTDTGGALCHSAIVSREYGIPAVVGTGVATSVIKDGQTIEVDGDRGIVRIIE
jgi:thioesterase domain-containing protein/phosphohistidine swiveling domain-containing protein/acyl carrier protein